MSHPTTFRLHHTPTLALRTPRLDVDSRRRMTIAIHLGTAVLLAASIATAIAGAADRVTGAPELVQAPELIRRMPSDVAPVRTEPEPRPSPAGA